MEDSLNFYTIYHPLKEAPEYYFVKKWTLKPGGVTVLDKSFEATSKSLEELRSLLVMEMKLCPVGRFVEDSPDIIETFI